MTGRWGAVLLGLAVAGPVLADAPSGPVPAFIAVTGHGRSEAPPDMATVSIGVTARASTAAAAIDETSAAAAKVVAAARAFGLADRDVRTGTVSLQPVYRTVRDPAGGAQPQPDGFSATNSVQLRIRDLARLGEFLRRGVGEGANRIDGLSFGLADRTAAERTAREQAVADAVGQAQVLARAAGVRLGAVREIRSGEARAGLPRPGPMQALRAGAVDVPVEPGTVEISADIDMTWAIEQP